MLTLPAGDAAGSAAYGLGAGMALGAIISLNGTERPAVWSPPGLPTSAPSRRP
jgi:hypothetical protein